MNEASSQRSPVSSAIVEQGSCWVMFVLDVGYSVDIERAEKLCSLPTERLRLKPTHKNPEEFEYRPAPLRITLASFPVTVGDFQSTADARVTVYDFGALSVTFEFPLSGQSLAQLVRLSSLIYEDEMLRATARNVASTILKIITPAVERPKVGELIEDYCIWEALAMRGAPPLAQLLTDHRLTIAQLLRADEDQLSPSEVDEALSYQLSYGGSDIVIVDWNGAFLHGRELDSVRSVLEFANVELLEIRLLDEQLDDDMEEAREILAKRSPTRAALRRIGHLQLDSTLLFEAINNAIKLVGDHYLARIYRLASESLHLEEREGILLRKVNVIKDIYTQMETANAGRRMEILEVAIILLIAVSVALQFMGR